MSCGEYKQSKRVHWQLATSTMKEGLLEGLLFEADATRRKGRLEEQVVGLGLLDVLGGGEIGGGVPCPSNSR